MSNLKSQTVPVIDLAPYFGDDHDGRLEVAKAVRETCEETGFLVVTNHGVDLVLQERVFAVCRQFFDLPLEEKQRASGVDTPLLGYNMLGSQRIGYSLGVETPPDLMESYSIGREDVDEQDPYFTSKVGRQVFPPNIWPHQPAGFRTVFKQYYDAMDSLAAKIMEIMALALGLPTNFFANKIDKSLNLLRTLNYPAMEETPLPGQSRIGAHTDYGILTIVLPDRPGLQVERSPGVWEDVPFVPGSLQINIGDLMARWTNDRWNSTMHRVLPPTSEDTNKRRMSIAHFLMGNYDALIETLPTCLEEGQSPHYPPISAGDHMFEKINRQFSVAEERKRLLG